MSRTIWFEYLTTAYVQTGKYTVAEKYLPGQHFTQGLGNITAPAVEADKPESFSREWATFVEGTEAASSGYDPGSYGIGVGVSSRTIDLPLVREVHLLYMYDLESTRQVRTLVQVPAVTDAETDLGTTSGLGIITDDLGRLPFSEDEYLASFAPAGFNRFGIVLPSGVALSDVSELHSLTGTFTDVESNTASYTVYMSPLYIAQDRPLFDFIYLQNSGAANLNGSGISGRLLRWQGGVVSTTIAPINREGSDVVRDGYLFNTSNQTTSVPAATVNVGVDGQTYTNADAYNVKNLRRQ